RPLADSITQVHGLRVDHAIIRLAENRPAVVTTGGRGAGDVANAAAEDHAAPGLVPRAVRRAQADLHPLAGAQRPFLPPFFFRAGAAEEIRPAHVAIPAALQTNGVAIQVLVFDAPFDADHGGAVGFRSRLLGLQGDGRRARVDDHAHVGPQLIDRRRLRAA